MKSFISRNYYRILIIIVSGFILIFLTGFFLSIYLENKIDVKLISYQGRASSINVSLWSRSIAFNGLTLGNSEDSIKKTHPFLRFEYASLRGIDLYDLIIGGNFSVDELVINNGVLYYVRQNSDSTKLSNTLKAISFKNIVVSNVETQVRTDTILNLSVVMNCHLTDVNFKIDSVGKLNYSVIAAEVTAQKLDFNRHEGTHGGSIAQLLYTSETKRAELDSVRVIPNYGKLELGQHFKQQKSRISLLVPKIIIEGLSFEKLIDSAFIASRIEILSFDVTAFKDKRLPFLKKDNVPMPMETFLKLPFHVNVDSIIIKDSHITIEEFPENAEQSIRVTFSHVNGKFAGLNNRIEKGDSSMAVLHAHGLLMNKGNVNAVFKFPLDGSPTYTAKGSIVGMPFAELNEALVNSAALRVQSGYLNSLTFDFNYTDLSSVGKLVINYENLRVSGLKKDKGINEIKTLLLNMFVKNDKTKLLPKAERTGTINVERDRKKFIFNLWWKSIRDGLKSSILGNDKTNSKKP
jgi:hypothetical protein